MADYNFSGLRKTDDPNTETTTPSGLAGMLHSMLPAGTLPKSFGQAPIDYLSALSSYTSPFPGHPTEDTLGAGRDLAKYGIPAAAGLAGASMGPVGSTVLGAGGELAGQWASGSPLDAQAAGISGALGGLGAVGGRIVSGASRAVRSMFPSTERAIDAAVNSGEVVPTTNIRTALDDIMTRMSRGGVGTGSEPTAGFEKLRKFATKFENTTNVAMPLDQVATMRDELGQLMVELKPGSPAFHKAQVLYGSLMSDLREAAAQGLAPSATGYLRAMTDKHIAHSLVPESMLERIMLYGLGSYGLGSGSPGALLPAAGLLGARAFRATPPSVLENVGAGAAIGANPYRK